jgi:hypothetical protein
LCGSVAKRWSNRQATVAMSSGEAELYAATKAAAELFGFASLMADLGWKMEEAREVRMDSSAARGMAGRRGLGKTRHIDVRRLWMQEVIESRRIATKKVPGSSKPLDVFAKLKSSHEVSDLLAAVRLFFS